MSNTIVLYHDSCADGYGAAFASWVALGDSAEYIPVQYGQEPPDAAWEADRLYILDFSYSRSMMIELARMTIGSVVCLDHHKSARESLDGVAYPNLTVKFDIEKSGAVLAWEHFHPGKPVPNLLLYVQDRDLWRWELPSSREFSAALSIEPKDFGRWDDINCWFIDLNELESMFRFTMFVQRGVAVLAAQCQHVDSIASKAYVANITTPNNDYTVPVVNSSIWQSEIGERILKLHPDSPFAAVFFILAPGDYEVWSLRSRSSDYCGGFDVSAVAKSLGGGGHRNSAGFKRKRN